MSSSLLIDHVIGCIYHLYGVHASKIILLAKTCLHIKDVQWTVVENHRVCMFKQDAFDEDRTVQLRFQLANQREKSMYLSKYYVMKPVFVKIVMMVWLVSHQHEFKEEEKKEYVERATHFLATLFQFTNLN
jgi:hypothetical protein